MAVTGWTGQCAASARPVRRPGRRSVWRRPARSRCTGRRGDAATAGRPPCGSVAAGLRPTAVLSRLEAHVGERATPLLDLSELALRRVREPGGGYLAEPADAFRHLHV